MTPCVLCVVRVCVVCVCVVGVQCVCWRVFWCVCVCVGVGVSRCTPSPLFLPLPPTPLSVCTFKTPPVCTGTTPASGTRCGRGAGTHGGVLNLHTGSFQRGSTKRWVGLHPLVRNQEKLSTLPKEDYCMLHRKFVSLVAPLDTIPQRALPARGNLVAE